MTIFGLYGNVGYGKNIFAVKYLRKMVLLGLKRQKQWADSDPQERQKLFKGIEPPKVLAKARRKPLIA